MSQPMSKPIARADSTRGRHRMVYICPPLHIAPPACYNAPRMEFAGRAMDCIHRAPACYNAHLNLLPIHGVMK